MAGMSKVLREQKRQQTKKLYLKGLSMQDIHETTGVSLNSLSRWKKEDGWEDAKKKSIISISELKAEIMHSFHALKKGEKPNITPDQISKLATAFEKISDRKKQLGYTYEAFESLIEKLTIDISQSKTKDKEFKLKALKYVAGVSEQLTEDLYKEVMNESDIKKLRERYKSTCKTIKSHTKQTVYKETAVEQEKRIKKLLKPQNYTQFFDYYFGADTPISLGDAPCADFHQTSYERLFYDRFLWQWRMWYRGAAKSIHSNVGNICHLKENDELFFALIVGKNETMAKKLLSDLQAHLSSNERYIKDFGLQVAYGHWSEGEFMTKDDRYFKALSVNQPFRGLRHLSHRVDFVSWDDCEDREQAKNKALIQQKGEKATGDVGKAFDFKRGRFVMSNNYIVKEGLCDFIRKRKPQIQVHQVNICDDKGNPSWHQRLSKEDVRRIIKADDYYTSQCEDFNNPIEEGKLFKAEWIKYVAIHGNRRSWNGIIFHWDLSYKKTGDYKACAVLGFGNGKIQLLDVFCRKCELSEAIQWHYSKMKHYIDKGMTPMAYYDATAAQEPVFSPIFRQYAHINNLYSIPMPAHVSTDKHLRIEATLTDVLFNRILEFDQRLKGTPDMKAAENQLLSFEKGMKGHDDFPDTLEASVCLGRRLFSYHLTEDTGGFTPAVIHYKRGGF